MDSKTNFEGGVTKNLVVTPPVDAIQSVKYIDWINKNIKQTNCMEICLTFKPTFRLSSLKSLKSIIKGIFERVTEDYPDVSAILLHEFSDTGMFHYHGIISRGTGKFYNTLRRNLIKYIGRTEIKQIKYWDSYTKYMTKQCHEHDYDKTLNILIPARAGIVGFFK